METFATFWAKSAQTEGIAETLEESPEHFCSYNNGITMVAEEATISGKLNCVGIRCLNRERWANHRVDFQCSSKGALI